MSSLKYCIKLVLLSILFTPTRQWSPHSYCCRHLKRTINTSSSTTITSRTNSHVSFSIKTHLLFQIKSDDDDDDDANNSKGKPFADTEKIQSNKIVSSPIVSFLREKVFLGIEPTPEIIAIMAIYFVEGALGLARLAQTFYLKDELHLGPAELSALTGLFTLPWTIKPIYGFLSDGLPLFGYRRRSYLILCGLLGALCYLGLGTNFGGYYLEQGNDAQIPISLLQATIASLVVSSGCIAFSDVVADGIVVQRTRDSADPRVAGGLQSLCWGSASMGGLISAYFSGSLLEVMTATDVFAITAVLPLLVAAIAFFIREDPIGPNNDLSPKEILPMTKTVISTSTSIDFSPEASNLIPSMAVPNSQESITSITGNRSITGQIQSLWQAIQEPSLWKPALFLFLWQSTPTSEGAFLYFMTNDLGMGPEFLGRVRLVTAAASLVGVWGYQKFLRTAPIRDILLWTSIASAPLGLVQLLLITHANRELGIPDAAFVLGDDVVLAVLGQFAFLPTLVLAAKICPPGVEAVLFATLMSIFNGASAVGTEIGAILTKQLGVTENDFSNLALLNVICNVSSLYPLLFIGLLDGVGTKSEAEMEKEEMLDPSSSLSSTP